MTTGVPTVVPLELSELAKPLPAALAAFRGRVVDVRPFSAHTQLAQFTLASIGTPADQQARAVVELKGVWAENACKRITKGDVLVLTTKGSTVLNAAATPNDDTEAKRSTHLRFAEGMTGWVQHRDGSEDLISYRRMAHKFPLRFDAFRADLGILAHDAASSKKRSAQGEAPRKAENKRTAKAAAAESTRARGTGGTMVPGSSTKDSHALTSTERRWAVPGLDRPSSLAVGTKPTSTSPSAAEPGSCTASKATPVSAPSVNQDSVTPSSTATADALAIAKPVKSVVHSAPGEGSRSRKRQRREEALGWGLETVRLSLLSFHFALHCITNLPFAQENGVPYQSLAQVAGVVDASDASTLQSKRTSIIALVTHAGPPYPPKQGAPIASESWHGSLAGGRRLRNAQLTRIHARIRLVPPTPDHRSDPRGGAGGATMVRLNGGWVASSRGRPGLARPPPARK